MKEYPANVKDESGKPDSVQPVAVMGFYGEDSESMPVRIVDGDGGGAGEDVSGSPTTSSGVYSIPENESRTKIEGQNVGTVDIGFNEFGEDAVLGAPGTWTVAPGSPFRITTKNEVNFIAASGTGKVTATEY